MEAFHRGLLAPRAPREYPGMRRCIKRASSGFLARGFPALFAPERGAHDRDDARRVVDGGSVRVVAAEDDLVVDRDVEHEPRAGVADQLYLLAGRPLDLGGETRRPVVEASAVRVLDGDARHAPQLSRSALGLLGTPSIFSCSSSSSRICASLRERAWSSTILIVSKTLGS